MTKIARVLFISLLFIFIVATHCFAINENELYGNNSFSNYNSTTENYLTNTNSVSENTFSYTDSNNYNDNYSSSNFVLEEDNNVSQNEAPSYSTSSTVSSVSSVSNNSTVANILNIALIVVGVLLIFLAIAILIRLHQ